MKTPMKYSLKELFPSIAWRLFAESQNDNKESQYLDWLCENISAKKTFIEFGFSAFEFNSISLAKKGYQGILLDGREDNCKAANKIFNSLGFNVRAIHHWIEIKSLGPIIDFSKSIHNEIGVLSVDIDGNDYWVLKELLFSINPVSYTHLTLPTILRV